MATDESSTSEPVSSTTEQCTDSIDELDICNLNDLNKNDPIKIASCIASIRTYLNSPISDSTCNDLKFGANYITSITTLISNKEKEFVKNKTNLDTFNQSIDQQVNPEKSISARFQSSGVFAPPRPLKPLSISILLGLTFVFFFISLTIIYKSIANTIPTGTSVNSTVLTPNTLKNLTVGILLLVILVLGLKLGKVI